MIIDCRDTGDYTPQVFMTELMKIIENYTPKRNCIVIPMSIFNIIEQHKSFNHDFSKDTSDYLLVGKVCGIECYLDLGMRTNSIILTWNKESLRDIKLESLLNDYDDYIDNLRIDVLI